MLIYFTLWPYLIGIPIAFAILMHVNGRMSEHLDDFVIGTAMCLLGAGLWPVVLIGGPPSMLGIRNKKLEKKQKIENYRLDQEARRSGLAGAKYEFHEFTNNYPYGPTYDRYHCEYTYLDGKQCGNPKSAEIHVK